MLKKKSGSLVGSKKKLFRKLQDLVPPIAIRYISEKHCNVSTPMCNINQLHWSGHW